MSTSTKMAYCIWYSTFFNGVCCCFCFLIPWSPLSLTVNSVLTTVHILPLPVIDASVEFSFNSRRVDVELNWIIDFRYPGAFPRFFLEWAYIFWSAFLEQFNVLKKQRVRAKINIIWLPGLEILFKIFLTYRCWFSNVCNVEKWR